MARMTSLLLLVCSLFAAGTLALLPDEEPLRIDLSSFQPGEVAYERVIKAKGASSMRLFFASLELPPSSLLVLTSLSDGASQHMDAHVARLWRHSSAVFNGGEVLLQVKAGTQHPLALRSPHLYGKAIMAPSSALSRARPASRDAPSAAVLHLARIEVEERSPLAHQSPLAPGRAEVESICYNPDTRVFSNDTRQGRYIYGNPNGCCTAWMIDDANHCFLSAGHCTEEGNGLVEFNVPLSAEDGTLVHPPVQDQFIIDQESMQTEYIFEVDWRYFGVFANTETGLSPIEAYSGEYYTLLKEEVDPPVGAKMTVIGYGENESFPPTHRRVLKTASGPFETVQGNAIRYRVDTSNGNSGSAVFDEERQVAVGIHTLGGCRTNSATSVNAGVNIFTRSLQDALKNPRGICAGGR